MKSYIEIFCIRKRVCCYGNNVDRYGCDQRTIVEDKSDIIRENYISS